MIKRTGFLSVLIFGLILVSACSESESTDSVSPEQVSLNHEGVVVHLFEWRWDDVAAECEEFLGPAGYSAVQISPPSENHIIEGRPWYERYQLVSYKLETRSGTREQLVEMVSRCAKVGVGVYADVLINHTTDSDLKHETLGFSGRGTAGSEFSSYSFPGLFDYDDFHHCGLTPNDDIQNWDDAIQIRECELVDLADLKTESPHVRSVLASYIEDLASIGITGLRVDAAKHVYPEDLAAILDEAEFSGYIVQEVSLGGIDRTEYFASGDVTEFGYGYDIHNAFKSRNVSALHGENSKFGNGSYAPSEVALLFLDNHDTQRNAGVLSYKDANLYALAQAFTLAYPYGRARVMSSFVSEGHENSPPALVDESIRRVHEPEGINCGKGDWVCEHRWPVISGAVAFSNATASHTDVTNWWTNGSDQIAFGRGSAGFFALNLSEETMTVELASEMPAGSYCNRLSEIECESVVVNFEGKVTLHLASMAALAIDEASRID